MTIMKNKESRLQARSFYTKGYAAEEHPEADCTVYRNGDLAMVFDGTAGKPTWGYRFKNSQQMENYIQKHLDARIKAISYKSERKAQKSAALANLCVKVGDVFCHSWGYEQTNIDFYVVTALSGRMATLRECGHIESNHMSHGMACDVSPDISRLFGPEIKKQIQVTTDGKPYLSFDYGWCGLTDPKETHYKSWYA